MKFFYVFKHCYSLLQIKFQARLPFYDECFDVACFNGLYSCTSMFLGCFCTPLCGSLFLQLF